MFALAELPLVVEANKQVNGTPERMNTAREAARPSGESGEVVPQVSIRALNRVGLALVIHHLMSAPPAEFFVSVEGIREVVGGVRCIVNDRLHHFWCAMKAYVPRDDATCVTIYDGDDVGGRFFEPTKVNSSSISSTSGLATGGAATGRAAW